MSPEARTADLRDLNGKCILCGLKNTTDVDEEGREHELSPHDDARHAEVKKRGYIRHMFFEDCHFQDEPCLSGQCRQEPEVQLPTIQPDAGDIQLMQLLVAGGASGALDLQPFTREDMPEGQVVWLLVARLEDGRSLLLGQLLPGVLGQGWIPVDAHGKPMGLSSKPTAITPPGAPPPTIH